MKFRQRIVVGREKIFPPTTPSYNNKRCNIQLYCVSLIILQEYSLDSRGPFFWWVWLWVWSVTPIVLWSSDHHWIKEGHLTVSAERVKFQNCPSDITWSTICTRILSFIILNWIEMHSWHYLKYHLYTDIIIHNIELDWNAQLTLLEVPFVHGYYHS